MEGCKMAGKYHHHRKEVKLHCEVAKLNGGLS
jgi:hypothetical protein